MIGRFAREDYLSADELAAALDLSLKTLANWRSTRTGPPYAKVGRKIFYPKDVLKRWLDKRVQGSVKSGGGGISG